MQSGRSVTGTGSTDTATADKANGNRTAKPSGNLVATYDYRDALGELVYQVLRYAMPDGSKTFKQRRPDGKGGWIQNLQGVTPLLYRLPELLASTDAVFIVEGEKDADRIASLKLTATCNSGGAGKWCDGFAGHLQGRDVVVLPDNDQPGRDHAEQVARSLQNKAKSIRVVELPGLPVKGDVSDWLGAGHDVAELMTVCQAAPKWTDTSDDESSTQPREIGENGELCGVVDAYTPFSVETLPDPLRGFVAEASKAIGCDPAYVALPLLTMLAAAIGNTRRLRLKQSWLVPPILWTAIVGESGTLKSPARRLALKAMSERQLRLLKRDQEALREYETAHARWAQQAADWKRSKQREGDPPAEPEAPVCERCLVSDTTVEALAPILLANPRGLLLERDELAGWIGSFDRYAGKSKAGGDSAHWLSMYYAESQIVDRRTGHPRTLFVPHAAVCVTGGIQPETLRRALGREHFETGLAARLLLACPPHQQKRWTEADIDPDSENEIATLVEALYALRPATDEQGDPLPQLVHLSPEAKQVWVAHYNAHNQEQVELTGDLAAAWSKLEETPARLALVLHCSQLVNGGPDKVSAETMQAGIDLATWFKRETRRVYAMLSETEDQRESRRLVEWLQQHGGSATARQVQQGCHWLKGSGLADEALEDLASRQYGRWEFPSTTNKGGRPTRMFVLSTASTSTKP